MSSTGIPGLTLRTRNRWESDDARFRHCFLDALLDPRVEQPLWKPAEAPELHAGWRLETGDQPLEVTARASQPARRFIRIE
jgi:hypothetical protein